MGNTLVLNIADVAEQLHHDDVIKWKHFPRYWPFVQGINRLHKRQCRGALMFSLICAWINGGVNNGEAGDLRRLGAHDDVTVMYIARTITLNTLPYDNFRIAILTNDLFKHIRE